MATAIASIAQLNKTIGQHQILTDINFEIPQGKIVGLIGANGAGKTTIMKAMLGITAFTGNIQIDGGPITTAQHRTLDHVGALIEYPGLYPYLTARQQLQLYATGPSTASKAAKVQAIIEQFQMTSYADTKTKKFSLGMKQKLGVALAFLNEPDLIVLDEPLNGLDPKATKHLRDLILAAKARGVSFLISSHLLAELQKVADEVVIIDHGRVIKATTMANLLAQTQPYYVIKTTDDAAARAVLTAGKFPVLAGPQLKLAKTDVPLNAALAQLLAADCQILDISRPTGDLEASLLAVLSAEH